LTKAIYRCVPVLTREEEPPADSWELAYREVIHMSHQAEALVVACEYTHGSDWLRLYEAKMIHHYDHRWLSFEGGDAACEISPDRTDPTALVVPRYFVKKQNVIDRIASDWTRDWLIGWRDITNTTNERSMIFTILPFVGLSNTLPLALVSAPNPWLLVSCL